MVVTEEGILDHLKLCGERICSCYVCDEQFLRKDNHDTEECWRQYEQRFIELKARREQQKVPSLPVIAFITVSHTTIGAATIKEMENDALCVHVPPSSD